ncbi:hypothetical protein RhiirA5_494932 [Rhizophagus irregularis]|uniref:Protein kinase domain-containing protein n=2 Tax=Rhizophagus irregularis TaxID=588596 RepID=A0A2N0Q7C9_9GLOM|nr:hypothetical protein RhiirA5_494932 [Rhizophagus irregularis]
MTSNSKVIKEIRIHKQNFCTNSTNIIKFLENENIVDSDSNYLFVSNYDETLANYLRNNSNILIWDTKLKFAIQIAEAVSYMHQANIIHRELANNILVHQNTIKFANFGLSHKVDGISSKSYSFQNTLPYIDPQHFQEKEIDNYNYHHYKGQKSDVYSVGVLLWEISSGKKPFKSYTLHQRLELMYEILNGKREDPIPNTPVDYINIYQKCWQNNPDNRPNMDQVLSNLKSINLDTIEILISDLLPLYECFIQRGMNENDCIQLIRQSIKSKNKDEDKIFNYLNILNINDRLQNIILFLAKFYQHGIGTEKNEIKAFELYKEAYEKNHISSMYMLGDCYKYGIGTENDETRAFELYKEACDKEHINSMYMLGCCYQYGIGTEKNEFNAFTLYKTAASRGHINSISSLGYCYQFGIGTKKDAIEAIGLYMKAAERGNERCTQIAYVCDNDNLTNLDYSDYKEIFVENKNNLMDFDYNEMSSHSSSHILKKNIVKFFGFSGEQIIRQFKLNHGIILSGKNIRPSIRSIIAEDGENLKMSLYKGQPLVYTINSNNDKPLDMCINFPIAEIIYSGSLVESFSKYKCNNEKSHELYGHFLARKFLAGGQLFIKDFNLATSTQIDILKFYLFYVYNSVKYSLEVRFNNLFTLSLLPKIVTMDGKELSTHEKLTKWMTDLYQRKMTAIISYNNLIPVTQLRHSMLSIENIESINEKQPGIDDFVRRLSLEEWVGDEVHDNLMNWTENFNLFQGLIFNNDHEIEISKKIAINFIEIPKVNLKNDKLYLKLTTPSTNMEVILISNNIFSIKDLSTFPFIKSNTKEYEDYAHILLKCERYEILLNKDHIKPTKEFEQLIENALNSIKPLEALQNIFNEYGHIFPQRIILGRSLKSILTSSPFCKCDTINFILETPLFTSLEQRLDYLNILYSLNISYLLTQEGKVVEKNDLINWIQNINNNLEIIEFDNIIPLYKILKVEQQRKIDDILKNDFRIIMTGITDLKDLDNNNDIHYKRINLNSELILKNDDYKVFGSIITENNIKLEQICVNFGLFDFNGFHAIIKKSKDISIDITKCYILWMIVGNPSKLSIFSSNNRKFQVDCIRESITIQPDKSNYCIKTPFPLSHGYTISVHAYYPSTNYEPINIIKLVGWNDEYINFQITYNEFDGINNSLTNIEIDLHICFLFTNYKNLKIDDEERECSIDLIGYILTEDNLNDKLPNEIESEVKSSLISDSDVEMIINDNATSGFEKFCNEIINEFEEQQNNIRKEIIDELDKFRSENLKFLRLSNVS